MQKKAAERSVHRNCYEALNSQSSSGAERLTVAKNFGPMEVTGKPLHVGAYISKVFGVQSIHPHRLQQEPSLRLLMIFSSDVRK